MPFLVLQSKKTCKGTNNPAKNRTNRQVLSTYFLCIILNLLLIALYWFNRSIFFPTNPSFSLKNDKIVFFFCTFASRMKTTILEDNIFDFESCEKDGSVLLAEETPWRGFADELQDLHYLKGAQFINQLKLIVNCGEFCPIAGETGIYSAIGEKCDDLNNLISAARKAVEHGYRVYILPNPRSCRTADFIFEKKGILGLYDLKTVYGKGSVGTQLLDSIGQTNRVLLNMLTDYNPRLLAKDIRRYFERNTDAIEVLIMKGSRTISVKREDTLGQSYFKNFMMKYKQK